jgi:type VI protein secretion system component Hcp
VLDLAVSRESDTGRGGSQSHSDWKSSARPSAKPATIRKKVDLSSCAFVEAIKQQTPIKKMQVDICAPRADGKLDWYLSYVFEECIVLSYSSELGEDVAPSETVVVDYLKLVTKFREWDVHNRPTKKVRVQKYDFVKAHDTEEEEEADDDPVIDVSSLYEA